MAVDCEESVASEDLDDETRARVGERMRMVNEVIGAMVGRLMGGGNEHVRKVLWTVFVAMAGLVVTRVLDPATTQQVVGIFTGT
jgi:hypothetical protein